MNGSMKRTNSGTFRVRWRDPDGKNRSRTFDSRPDAKRFLARVRSATAFNQQVEDLNGSHRPQLKLKDAAEDWYSVKSTRISARTQELYEVMMRKHLAPLMDQDLDEVTPHTVDRLLSDLPGGTTPKARTVLNQIFSFAVRNGYASSNPVALSERSATERKSSVPLPSIEDVARIAGFAGPYGVLINTAAFSGLRFGELTGLVRSDIDTDSQTISVTRQWNHLSKELTAPKTASSVREVPYADRLGPQLSAHLESYQPDEHVFVTSTGKMWHPSNFRNRVWLPAVREAGLSDLHFHDLRHVYASLLISQGVNIALVSRVLGHSTPKTTMSVYSGWFQQDLDAARAALSKS